MGKKIILKTAVVMILAAVIVCASSLCAFADEELIPDLPEDEWQGFVDSVPDDVKDRLDGHSFENEQELAKTAERMTSSEYITSVVLDVIGVELSSVLKFFFALCALVMVSAVFNAIGEGSDNSALSATLRFSSVGAMISYVIYIQFKHFELLEDFFSKLGGLFAGMIPVSSAIWAMGGNISTAGVGAASFSVMLSVSEAIFSYTLVPVCCILTVMGFCDSLCGDIRLGKLLGAIKKIYNFIIVLVMTVLLASLAAQTTLAASADTTAAKAARLVSGTVIPVLGGSVGETLRTVAAGIAYMKNAFGIGGIMMIAVLVLPTLMSLLLSRLAFLLCAGFADMLGCSSESRLLDSLGEVYGTMLAVCASAAALFIMALYVFMRSVIAIA